MVKKSKYNRRRAIDCKIVEKSKNNPGYCKYMITIAELDGTIHKQPAYGKDMQDALSRLMNTERTVKVEKKIENNTGLIFLIWLALMAAPAIFFGSGNTPWMLVYTMGTILVLMLITIVWYSYIKKGE
tara:strand:+ start:830 stop:1213 length:384 start_codon:yes stop_codon:yes gene_type:complete